MDADEFFEQIRAARQVKVRYGRANLTVARWGGVAMSEPIGTALRRWRAREVSDEEVGWAFVKDRVLEHTPSFSWEYADLEELVVLVTEVSEDPGLEARSVPELVAELDGLEKEERRQLAEASEKFRKATESVLPKFDSLLPQFDSLLPKFDHFKGFESVMPRFELMPSLESILPKFDMSASLAATPALAHIGGIKKILSDYSEQMSTNKELAAYWSNLVQAQTDSFQNLAVNPAWKDWSAYLAEAAVAADRPDVAEAVEATSDLEADDANAEEFLAAMLQLWEFLMAALAKAKGPAEKVAIEALATLVVLWLVYFLAKLGIPILPPELP